MGIENLASKWGYVAHCSKGGTDSKIQNGGPSKEDDATLFSRGKVWGIFDRHFWKGGDYTEKKNSPGSEWGAEHFADQEEDLRECARKMEFQYEVMENSHSTVYRKKEKYPKGIFSEPIETIYKQLKKMGKNDKNEETDIKETSNEYETPTQQKIPYQSNIYAKMGMYQKTNIPKNMDIYGTVNNSKRSNVYKDIYRAIDVYNAFNSYENIHRSMNISEKMEIFEKVEIEEKMQLYDKSDILDYYPGFPLPSQQEIQVRKNFISSLNPRTRIPNWVAERVLPKSWDGHKRRPRNEVAKSARKDGGKTEESAEAVISAVEEKDRPEGSQHNERLHRVNFKKDKWMREDISPDSMDFKNSGYDRGHLACVANRRAQEDISETFCLGSNVVPQHPHANSTSWLYLERLGRTLASYYKFVYCISGPLWLPTDYQDYMGGFAPQILTQKFSKGTFANSQHDTAQRKGNAENGAPTKQYKKLLQYEVIGEHMVSVPTHLFKIYVISDPINIPFHHRCQNTNPTSSAYDQVCFPKKGIACFIVPNKSELNDPIVGGEVHSHTKHRIGKNIYAKPDPCNIYLVSLKHLEFFSGLDFSAIRKFGLDTNTSQLDKVSTKIAHKKKIKNNTSKFEQANSLCHFSNPYTDRSFCYPNMRNSLKNQQQM